MGKRNSNPPPQWYQETGELEGSNPKNSLGDNFVSQTDDFTRAKTSNIIHWGVLRE